MKVGCRFCCWACACACCCAICACEPWDSCGGQELVVAVEGPASARRMISFGRKSVGSEIDGSEASSLSLTSSMRGLDIVGFCILFGGWRDGDVLWLLEDG